MGDDAAAMRDLVRKAGSQRPLEAREQEDLLRRAAAGDQAGQDRLVEVFLPTVVRLAAARREHGLSLPDLVQEGSIGVIEAIRTFSASGEADFAGFAESHITAPLDSAIDAEAAGGRATAVLITAARGYRRTRFGV